MTQLVWDFLLHVSRVEACAKVAGDWVGTEFCEGTTYVPEEVYPAM